MAQQFTRVYLKPTFIIFIPAPTLSSTNPCRHKPRHFPHPTQHTQHIILHAQGLQMSPRSVNQLALLQTQQQYPQFTSFNQMPPPPSHHHNQHIRNVYKLNQMPPPPLLQTH